MYNHNSLVYKRFVNTFNALVLGIEQLDTTLSYPACVIQCHKKPMLLSNDAMYREPELISSSDNSEALELVALRCDILLVGHHMEMRRIHSE